jgi:mediator of RNA polymerase II transcription subunit 31
LTFTAPDFFFYRASQPFQMQSPSTAHSPLQTADSDPRSQNRTRFELELEFVQSLANPFYLHSLAQQGIFEQPHFIRYLEYLKYWGEKEYARFLQCVIILIQSYGLNLRMLIGIRPKTSYPHALHHLELLQYPQFRAEMKKDDWRDFLNQKQFDHWRTWSVHLILVLYRVISSIWV